MKWNQKEYIGDSVYAEWNEIGELVLTTENGMGVSNTIYLEPETLEALCSYIDRARTKAKEIWEKL